MRINQLTDEEFEQLKRRIEAPTLRQLYKDGKFPLVIKLTDIEYFEYPSGYKVAYLTGSEDEYIYTESKKLFPILQKMKLPKTVEISIRGHTFDIEEVE